MARLLSRATGNFTASIWNELFADGVQDSVTASTFTTTSYVYSPTFTITNGAVVEGVLLYIRRASTGGTLSVALSEDNGSTAAREVTIDIADLTILAVVPALSGQWAYFKFATTFTSAGGSNHRIGVKTSTASTAVVFRNATAANWARLLCSTTTAAPAATDDLYVVGERTGAGASASVTVTMNNTAATAFGRLAISDGGTLTWGTAASTNYLLHLAGNLSLHGGGSYVMGSSGTPIPRSSTARLEFPCASNAQYGILMYSHASWSAYGESRTTGKNVVQTLLDGDHASGVSELTVLHDTGWLDGDTIIIAATHTASAASHTELRTLTANAGASTLSLNSATSQAHYGGTTDADVVAEVINVTRNVWVGTTTAFTSYFSVFGGVSAFATEWTQYHRMGGNVSNQQGICFNTAVSVAVIRYCSFSACLNCAISVYTAALNTGADYTIEDCVFYDNFSFTAVGLVHFAGGTGTSWTISLQRCTMLSQGDTSSARGVVLSLPTSFTLIDTPYNLTVSHIRVAGGQYGFVIDNPKSLTISNCVAHCVWTSAFLVTGEAAKLTLDTCLGWLTGNRGLEIGTSVTMGLVQLLSCQFFGAGTYNILINGSIMQLLIEGGKYGRLTGVTGGSGQYMLAAGGGSSANPGASLNIRQRNASLGAAGGGLRADHSIGLWDPLSGSTGVWARSFQWAILGGAAPVLNNAAANLALLHPYRGIISIQTSGVTMTSVYQGTIEPEVTVIDTEPGLRMTPVRSDWKLDSSANQRGRGFMVAVASGVGSPVSVKVRKSGAYNGAAPRLIVKANPAIGLTADTVIDTHSVAADTWETLSGNTPASSANGVVECVVDCDGTAGFVYVETWS